MHLKGEFTHVLTLIQIQMTFFLQKEVLTFIDWWDFYERSFFFIESINPECFRLKQLSSAHSVPFAIVWDWMKKNNISHKTIVWLQKTLKVLIHMDQFYDALYCSTITNH